MISLIYISLDFHQKYVFHKATVRYRQFKICYKTKYKNVLISFLDLDCYIIGAMQLTNTQF